MAQNIDLTKDNVKNLLIQKAAMFLDQMASTQGSEFSSQDKVNFSQAKEKLKYYIFVEKLNKHDQAYFAETVFRFPGEEFVIKVQFKIKQIQTDWLLQEIRIINYPENAWQSVDSFILEAKDNLARALHMGKVKAAMVDLRTIGFTIESYIVDESKVPEEKSLREISLKLQPFYIRQLPLADPWGNDYLYMRNSVNLEEYSIGSCGRDGKFQGWDQSGKYDYMDMGNSSRDIIFCNGEFTFCPRVSPKTKK